MIGIIYGFIILIVSKILVELLFDQNGINKMGNGVVSGGISMGSALAMILSYTTHHSILWAIINGVFSWIYVIYWYVKFG